MLGYIQQKTATNRAIAWINENEDLLLNAAKILHEAGYSHNYAFDYSSHFMSEVVAIALEDLSHYQSDRDIISQQIRSFIANRMHDNQWYDRPKVRTDNAKQ